MVNIKLEDLIFFLKNGAVFEVQEYIERNVKEKLSKCQPLDIIILKIILEDALINECITEDGVFNPKYSQAMSYSTIIIELDKYLKGDVNQACQISIMDLCNYGFIVQAQLNLAREWAYGLTPLGIGALKILKAI